MSGPNPNIRFSRGTTEIRDESPCGFTKRDSSHAESAGGKFWHQKKQRFPSGPWQHLQKSCKIYSSLIFQQISWATKYPPKQKYHCWVSQNCESSSTAKLLGHPINNSNFAPEKWWQVGGDVCLESFWDSSFFSQVRTVSFREKLPVTAEFLKLKFSKSHRCLQIDGHASKRLHSLKTNIAPEKLPSQ